MFYRDTISEIPHSLEIPFLARSGDRAFHGKCEGMEPLFSEKSKKSFSDFQECMKYIPEFFYVSICQKMNSIIKERTANMRHQAAII